MPLPPSRKDVIGPPPLDTSDLAYVVRHLSSASRQIDPGLLGGRAITPRPVPYGPSQLVGEDSGGDGEDILFENGDRVVATVAGTITLNLTYEPLDGSLHIRWNGIDQPPLEWTLVDQTVTFVHANIHVGDVLTAAYAYIEGEDVPDAATLVLRGVTADYGASGDPSLTGLALHASTVIGDLIVISHQDDGGPAFLTFTDSRLTQVGDRMHIGFATDLSDIDVVSTGGAGSFWAIACATFQTNAVGWTAAVEISASLSPGGSLGIGSVSGTTAAVCGIFDTHSVVDGNCDLPTGYTSGGGSGSGKAHARVDYWVDPALPPVDSTSPAGSTSTFNGGAGGGYSTVVGLIGPPA